MAELLDETEDYDRVGLLKGLQVEILVPGDDHLYDLNDAEERAKAEKKLGGCLRGCVRRAHSPHVRIEPLQ